MSTDTPIGKFRNCMKIFIDKLRSWADKDQLRALEKFEIKYNLAMKANPRGSLELFMEQLEPHADHILSGNDGYLMKGHVEVEDEYEALLQQIKVWWPTLEEVQQHYIKKQFQLLLMLGARAVKHEGLRQVINRYRDPSNPLVY